MVALKEAVGQCSLSSSVSNCPLSLTNNVAFTYHSTDKIADNLSALNFDGLLEPC